MATNDHLADLDALRDALSCSLGAYLTDDLGEAFLHHLIALAPDETVALAARWGWDDTEAREEVCGHAERLLGLSSGFTPDQARQAYQRWMTDHD
ncbi:hypothetical protein [Nocardiopsis alba]|uniref:hypothetical protein n=1 Tax=Nocardiopsis alba TaxID=53437 RepID=UPI0033B4CBA7